MQNNTTFKEYTCKKTGIITKPEQDTSIKLDIHSTLVEKDTLASTHQI